MTRRTAPPPPSRLATGGIVAHAFANFYAITTRGDAETVRRVNAMKGRPPGQVGSITGSPAALWEAWDLDRLPDGLDRRAVRTLVDTFFALGPFGFRGPAAAGVPPHLTFPEGDVTTAQVIAPGYACPSNSLPQPGPVRLRGRPALHHLGQPVPAPGRRRRLTGRIWRAGRTGRRVRRRGRFCRWIRPTKRRREPATPRLPMSTTILGLHTVTRRRRRPAAAPDPERRRIDAGQRRPGRSWPPGYGLVTAAMARRLQVRDYSSERRTRPDGLQPTRAYAIGITDETNYLSTRYRLMTTGRHQA